MTDDTPDEPMTVTLHKDDEPDFTVEQGTFETVGISVENAVPKEDLRELIEEWRTEGIQIHPGMPNISEALGEKAADELEALLDRENDA